MPSGLRAFLEILSAAVGLGLLAGGAALAGEITVEVGPRPAIDHGTAGWVKVTGLPEGAEVGGQFDNRPIFFFPLADGGRAGLFGADVMLKPGLRPLTVTWNMGQKKSGQKSVNVQVLARDYGSRSITVPENQVDLSPEDLRRVEAESKEVSAALAVRSPVKLWQGPFLKPVDSSVISAFGRKTVINGRLNPRPHSGMDLRAAGGTKVKAPADGVVLLAGDHFFAGQSIYLDHGQGLLTMYFHLSAMEVQAGEAVVKGQVIGKVGATGRVTGPHLHYGLYLNGARIDPFSLHRLLESPPFSGDPRPPVSRAG